MLQAAPLRVQVDAGLVCGLLLQRPLSKIIIRLNQVVRAEVDGMQNKQIRPGKLQAGVAKIDISARESTVTSNPLYAAIDASNVNDPLYVKALIIKSEEIAAVIITIDAVAVGEIGTIHDGYLNNVRGELQKTFEIKPENVLINASHCHGVVCADVERRTIDAVKKAWESMVPVRIGAGRGYEDRITENRRLKLKNGAEADVRRAYSLPPDEEIAGVGPIDSEIGVLRIDRYDGRVLAVVYNFACHPIQGVPGGGNTADITGFASKVIEDSADDGTVALFLQGCAGDINPVMYRAVDRPRDAEPLGNLLGLSTARALRKITAAENAGLTAIREHLTLPRVNLVPHIEAARNRQRELLDSLKCTPLNLKTFLLLLIKYRLFPDFPSYDSHHYLHEKSMGRDHFEKLDAENRKNLDLYIHNIGVTEELTRVQSNLDLLTLHHEQYLSAGKDTIEVEMTGLRIGDFVLITFPGELSVEIGLNIKKSSPHDLTFIAGVTNGYIYYTPTAEQMKNRGGAQEDSDCVLAPEWQKLFEAKVREILGKL